MNFNVFKNLVCLILLCFLSGIFIFFILDIPEALFNQDFNSFKQGLVIFYLITLFLIIYLFYLIIYTLFISNRNCRLKEKIRRDLSGGQYLLYYQPIINPNDDLVHGYEALIRYKCDLNTIITPDKFLEQIRQYEMMSELTIWLLNNAIQEYRCLSELGKINSGISEDFYISINLSSIEVLNQSLVKVLGSTLMESGIGIGKICIELTERDKIDEMEKICDNLNLLKESGFLIAIDDFGAGYATLSLLNKIPFDILKFDKTFVDDLEISPMNHSLLKSVARWGEDFNKALVFEGVENEIQINFIKQFGIRRGYIQGYYYSKPLNKKDLFSYIARIKSEKINL